MSKIHRLDGLVHTADLIQNLDSNANDIKSLLIVTIDHDGKLQIGWSDMTHETLSYMAHALHDEVIRELFEPK